MGRRVRTLGFLLACVVLAAEAAGQAGAADRAADPEQGAIRGGAYVNPYFGLRYPLPPGWKAGPSPPPPSVGGYYVLSTPAPPDGEKATILIGAQDAFFAAPPLADAGELARNLAQSAPAATPDPGAARNAVTIAGHPFIRLHTSGTPLARVVFATDLRCHVVIFSFTAADPARLNELAASLDRLSFEPGPAAPACVKGYATAQTIRRKVEPAPAGPHFADVPVRILIAADGSVAHIHVIRAAAAQKRSIEDALRQWGFAPYRVSGQAREIETGLSFEFAPAGTAKR